jgi:hypothetical protein
MYQHNHIKKSKKTYLGHTGFAFYAGIILIVTGIISIIHSVIPNLFPFYPERIIAWLLEKNQQLKIKK